MENEPPNSNPAMLITPEIFNPEAQIESVNVNSSRLIDSEEEGSDEDDEEEPNKRVPGTESEKTRKLCAMRKAFGSPVPWKGPSSREPENQEKMKRNLSSASPSESAPAAKRQQTSSFRSDPNSCLSINHQQALLRDNIVTGALHPPNPQQHVFNRSNDGNKPQSYPAISHPLGAQHGNHMSGSYVSPYLLQIGPRPHRHEVIILKDLFTLTNLLANFLKDTESSTVQLDATWKEIVVASQTKLQWKVQCRDGTGRWEVKNFPTMERETDVVRSMFLDSLNWGMAKKPFATILKSKVEGILRDLLDELAKME